MQRTLTCQIMAHSCYQTCPVQILAWLYTCWNSLPKLPPALARQELLAARPCNANASLQHIGVRRLSCLEHRTMRAVPSQARRHAPQEYSLNAVFTKRIRGIMQIPQSGKDMVPAEVSISCMQPALGSPNLTRFADIGKEQRRLQEVACLQAGAKASLSRTTGMHCSRCPAEPAAAAFA